MVMCGTKQFKERFKVLESLEYCWRIGREIKSVDCFPDRRKCSQENREEFSWIDNEDDDYDNVVRDGVSQQVTVDEVGDEVSEMEVGDYVSEMEVGDDVSEIFVWYAFIYIA